MLISLRECTCSSEAGVSRRIYELAMTAQVSNGLPGLLRSQAVLLIIGLAIALVIGGVIFPAVWSRERKRRRAALDVLDRILPWRALIASRGRRGKTAPRRPSRSR